MKKEKSLSDLIKKANKSNPDHSLGEVKGLLDSGKKSAMQHNNSYQPRRINKLFNPLNLIVMTLIIALLTTIFLVNPWSEKGAEETVSKGFQVEKSELQVAGSRFQVEKSELQVAGSKFQVEKINKTEELNAKSMSIKPSSIDAVPSEILQEVDNSTEEIRDSIIHGRIFELNNDQLEKLGFHIDDGYYYLNELPDGSHVSLRNLYLKTAIGKGGEYGFFRIGDYRKIERFRNLSASSFDFYPQVITNISGLLIDQIIKKGKLSAEEFEQVNDQFIPILFKYKETGGFKKQDLLIWFKISAKFVDLLKNEIGVSDQELEFVETILEGNVETKVDYNFEIEIEEFEGLKLDKKTLECLGFSISDSALDYKYEHNGDWLTFFYNQTGLGHNNLSLSKFKNLQDSLKLIKSPPLLCGMTDFLGKYHITLPAFEDISDEGISGDFFDYCIPIQVCEINGLPNIEKTNFWFYPNERFFSCLPDSISEPMRKEFNYHKRQSGIVEEIIIEGFVPTKAEEVPCHYFPSFCEGLPGLDNLNVYPNPAEEIVNMEVILSRGKSIDYRIFDLSGRLLVDGLPTRKYSKEGKYTEKMDVSSLTPGLYLLVLIDDEGARMSKRLVKN